jgi:hypothetical protein
MDSFLNMEVVVLFYGGKVKTPAHLADVAGYFTTTSGLSSSTIYHNITTSFPLFAPVSSKRRLRNL